MPRKTRQQLEYIHLQILSVLTGDHIRRIFEKRSNFDLRRHLSGAEVFLHSLITRMQYDLAISMSSLLCLPLEASLRRKIGSILVPAKMKVCEICCSCISPLKLLLQGHIVCSTHCSRTGCYNRKAEETLRTPCR